MNATTLTPFVRRSTALVLAFCVLALAAALTEAGGRNSRNVATRNTTQTNFSVGVLTRVDHPQMIEREVLDRREHRARA